MLFLNVVLKFGLSITIFHGTSAYWFAGICLKICSHKRIPSSRKKFRKNRSRNREETVSEDDDVMEEAAVTTRVNRFRKKLGLKTESQSEL